MFHTIISVYLRPRRTLSNSADLPPGLYSSTMGPSYKTHFSLRTIQLCTARLSSLHNSVHTNVSEPNNEYHNKHLNSDIYRNHINLRNTHIFEHYNKAVLSHNIDTSCYFKKTRGTPRLPLPPQEATTSKGRNLLRRHTRLLSNPKPLPTTCSMYNIQSPSQ